MSPCSKEDLPVENVREHDIENQSDKAHRRSSALAAIRLS